MAKVCIFVGNEVFTEALLNAADEITRNARIGETFTLGLVDGQKQTYVMYLQE